MSPLVWCQDQAGNSFYWCHEEGCYVYSTGHRWYPATKTWTQPQPQHQQAAPQTPRSSSSHPAAINIDSGTVPTVSSYPSPSEPKGYITSHGRQQSSSSGGSDSRIPNKSQYGSNQAQAQAPSAPSGDVQLAWQGTVIDSGSYQSLGTTQTTPRPISDVNLPVTQGSSQPVTLGGKQRVQNTQDSSSPKCQDWQPKTPAPSDSTSRSRAAKPSTQGTRKPIRRNIRSTPGKYEELDRRYKKRSNKWFRHGRVFKMHWSQPMGESNATVVTELKEPLPTEYEKYLPIECVRDRRFGQYIFSKIRWFIVVSPRTDYCLCVPIITYQGKGVKKDVTKNEHAIVHTTKEVPDPDPEEEPTRDERPMRTPIRVQPDEKGDRLLEMSRIDYGRVYTVEQNVKAMAFGWVHKDSRKDLAFDFLNVFIGEEGYRVWRDVQKQLEVHKDADNRDDDEAEEGEEGGEERGEEGGEEGEQDQDEGSQSEEDDSEDDDNEANDRKDDPGLPTAGQAPLRKA